MSINVSQAFHRTSANPVDDTMALTKAEMLTVNDNLMPSKYLTVCQDDGAIYLYDKSATASAETGKFTKFEGGSSGTANYNELENKPIINSVTLSGSKTSSDLHLANAPIVTSQTLETGNTTVTFGGLPASGDHFIDFFTSNGANYSAITISGATVVLTYPVQSSDITVYCRVEEM